MTAQQQGNLSGKRIFTHESSLRMSEPEIAAFISQFNTFETFFKICSLSNNLFQPKGICHHIDVPYHDGILCEAIVLVIKYGNPKSPNIPNDIAIKMILRICLGLEDERLRSIGNPKGIMMKVSYDQFSTQEDPHNAIGRMWHILNSSWNSVENQTIDPMAEIQQITGLNFRGILCYGLGIASDKQGSIIEYGIDAIQKLEDALNIGLTPDSHNCFLNWISCKKEQFTLASPIPAYVRYPVLNCEVVPAGCTSPVFFVPSPNYVISRISTGIYFDLIDKFKSPDGRSNQFKAEYGYAFEKYVGEIIYEHLGSFSVSPEIEYGPRKARVKSVDYFAQKEGKLILFEVKQSSIAAPAKFSGDIEDLSTALKTNTEKAIKQLKLTEEKIKEAPELAMYKDCTDIIKVVVMGDPLYNANNIIKLILKEQNGVDSAGIHFINISDFEDLLDAQESSQNLYDKLLEKEKMFPDLDFKEFIQKSYSAAEKKRKFQTRNFDEAMPSIDPNQIEH